MRALYVRALPAEGPSNALFHAKKSARRTLAGLDIKNTKSTGVSVFETLLETPKPCVSAF